jgi:hypothetical protein
MLKQAGLEPAASWIRVWLELRRMRTKTSREFGTGDQAERDMKVGKSESTALEGLDGGGGGNKFSEASSNTDWVINTQ